MVTVVVVTTVEVARVVRTVVATSIDAAPLKAKANCIDGVNWN